MDEEDLNSLMDELQIPRQLKDDFLTVFGQDLFVDLRYSFDKHGLERKVVHIGKMQIEDGQGIPVDSDPQQYKSLRGWSEYVRDAKDGKTISSQLEEYPNRRIQFGNTIDNIIGRFLFQRILIIPEYREKPQISQISTVPIRSPTGRELPSALHSLRNSSEREKWESFETIQKTFHELFSINLVVTNQPAIIFTNGREVSHESVGAGIIAVLTILTHFIGFKGNVFFIDEPELHLHPHSKRLLATLIKEYSKENQIIGLTHSAHFVQLDEVEKITLIREVNGQSELFRVSNPIKESVSKRLLPRIMRSDQKEFFFSRAVLLVEGDTEFGAIPILEYKLGYGLDSHSVSVIPMGNNYFAYFMELLSAFKIPYVIICDRDALMTITNAIKFQTQDVKTSTLIKQLDDLGKLTDSDRQIINSLSKKIIKIKQKDVYEDSCYQVLVGIIQQKYRLIVLNPDFEGVFAREGHTSTLMQAQKEFPNSKVLQGKFLAEKVKSQDIPSEFKDVIEQLKNLSNEI